MNVQNFKVIEKFARNHADSRPSLDSWYKITRNVIWRNFADVRMTFNSADIYKCCVIFDIGGNKYRLIAYIDYEIQTISIVEVLTHADYDKDKWKRHC